jgi:hypothetical protein
LVNLANGSSPPNTDSDVVCVWTLNHLRCITATNRDILRRYSLYCKGF